MELTENLTHLIDKTHSFIDGYNPNEKENDILSIRTSDYKSCISLELQIKYDALLCIISMKDCITGKVTLVGTFTVSIEFINSNKDAINKFKENIDKCVLKCLQYISPLSLKEEFSISILSSDNDEEENYDYSNFNEKRLEVFNNRKLLYKKKTTLAKLPKTCIDLICVNSTVEIVFRGHIDYLDTDISCSLYIDRYKNIRGFDCIEIYVLREWIDNSLIPIVDSDNLSSVWYHFGAPNNKLSMDNILLSDDKNTRDTKLEIETSIIDACKSALELFKKVGSSNVKYKIYTFKGGVK